MFGRDGSHVDYMSARVPRNSHPYQISDFDLLNEPETKEEAQESNGSLRRFPGSTCHGNSGARRAEVMASTLAFGGRAVGRFFVLPGRSEIGKTTRDLAFFYFVGSAASSGNRSMG